MGGEDFKSNVIDSFKKVKEHMAFLENQISLNSNRFNDADKRLKLLENNFLSFQKTLNSIDSQFKILTDVVSSLANKINNQTDLEGVSKRKSSTGNDGGSPFFSSDKLGQTDPLVSFGTSPKMGVYRQTSVLDIINSDEVKSSAYGKSSTRNRGLVDGFQTKKANYVNPLVSFGTSPKKEKNKVSEGSSLDAVLGDLKLSKRSSKLANKIIEISVSPVYLSEIYKLLVEKEELCSKTTFYRVINSLVKAKLLEETLDSGKRLVRLSKKL
ncbi:MAG: hypothetical protein ACOC1P_02780 [Minisyncoccales bacterium]